MSNYTNLKKILRVFFINGKTSFNHGNLKYLFDVAIQIDKKVPREKYKKHFEELRLRNIYSELEPLTIFFTFMKNITKVDTIEEVENNLKVDDISKLLKENNIKLSDFKNLNSKDMVNFTNDMYKIYGLKFNGYKHHIQRFSEYEMIHDNKNI